MSITPIILARSGSKGIPNKNIKLFNGRPLIFNSIISLLQVPNDILGQVIISTDSFSYKDLIESNYTKGQVHVQMRPDELAGDQVTSEDTLDYVITHLDNIPEYILFVQCTSPLTTCTDFGKLIHHTIENDFDSSCFCLDDYGHFFEYDDMRGVRIPRQQRKPKLRECGNAWMFKTSGFLLHKTRLFGTVGTVHIEYPKCMEIDTEEEFRILEAYLKEGF